MPEPWNMRPSRPVPSCAKAQWKWSVKMRGRGSRQPSLFPFGLLRERDRRRCIGHPLEAGRACANLFGHGPGKGRRWAPRPPPLWLVMPARHSAFCGLRKGKSRGPVIGTGGRTRVVPEPQQPAPMPADPPLRKSKVEPDCADAGVRETTLLTAFRRPFPDETEESQRAPSRGRASQRKPL